MGLGSGIAGDVSMNTVLSEEDRERYQDPGIIRTILSTAKTIAMVGLSPKSERPSHFVASYLKSEGYRVIPVNPKATEILGEKAYPDLQSISFPIDLVNVFRQPEECFEIAQDAIRMGAKGLWLQLRVVNVDAARLAYDAGLRVVMDRCVKIEHGRYGGSLHWVGMNTELISARRAQRYF
ncbi:MAG: CoA-binding protein [Anaerolineales bacterium]|nr:CoA-binding protein [Anaerolineales bacterium]